ncbi:hypothetical protein MTBGP_07190 [Moorella thermoacetica]|uniref:glycosyltransferase n=1 Tax=Neomoorella thermoacetica TaxID=1525 RepID=UPI0030D33436
MFSIVCVYNDKRILNEWLLASLKIQDAPYETILLDNTGSTFTSAAEALNYGGEQARGDYIMFVHQDVRLEKETWIEEAETWLRKLPDLGVAGVAGMSDKNKVGCKELQRNLIKHGVPPKMWGNVITQPEIVQTVDELLLIVPRRVFKLLKFDAQTCPGWHLYGVNYSLSALQRRLLTYVLPLPVWHLSTGGGPSTPFGILLNYGTMPKEYYRDLKRVLKKHRQAHRNIYTTCGIWNTNQPLVLQRGVQLFMMSCRYITKKCKGN